MVQKAKGENVILGRYERTQLKETPRISTMNGGKKEGVPTKGTEAKFDYTQSKLRK